MEGVIIIFIPLLSTTNIYFVEGLLIQLLLGSDLTCQAISFFLSIVNTFFYTNLQPPQIGGHYKKFDTTFMYIKSMTSPCYENKEDVN